MRWILSKLVMVGVCGLAAMPADAQTNDRLRALLEGKFQKTSPPSTFRGATRSIAPRRDIQPAAPSAENPDELLVIRPGDAIQRVPVKKAPDRQSNLAPPVPAIEGTSRMARSVDGPLGQAWGYVRSFWGDTPIEGDKPLTLQAGAGSGLSKANGTSSGSRSLTPGTIQMAQSNPTRMRKEQTFGVVPDVYLIQFKNTVSSRQIDDVVRRYDLNVVGSIPILGVVYVSRKPERTRGATRSIGGTRGVTGSRGLAGAPSSPPAASVLNPSFLQELRKEPGVNAATVHSTISTKNTPRPTDTTIADGDKRYSWTWRPDVADDGNWGLKRMRMPSVWQILRAARSAGTTGPRVTAAEALDMLQAMNTGHDGSLTTVHANTPRDTLSRLETLTLMSGFDLPVRAIREQMASAIDLIIQISRLRDGSRRVTHITEVQGMEGDVITLQDIFLFDFSAGVDDQGRYRGVLKATGIRPKFAEKLVAEGIRLGPETFQPAGASQ